MTRFRLFWDFGPEGLKGCAAARGGFLNTKVLTIDNGVFDVLATNGDAHLGGEDFNQRVMQHFINVFKKNHGKDMSGAYEGNLNGSSKMATGE